MYGSNNILSGRLIYTCTCSSGLAAEEHLVSTNFRQDPYFNLEPLN